MQINMDIELRNVKKMDVPDSTFAKAEAVLRRLKQREDKNMKPKYKKSIAVAAALAAVFIISCTALAAITLRSKQHADLRDILQIEGKDIPEYVEYPQAEAVSTVEKETDIFFITENEFNENILVETAAEPIDDENFIVNVFSSMKDQLFVYYYISVSPVTSEQAESGGWFFRREGMDRWGFANPAAGTLDKYYYESEQSLLLKLAFMLGSNIDADETEPFAVTLLHFDATDPRLETESPMTLDQLREHMPDAFTSADFFVVPNKTDIATVSFYFGDGVEFENTQTGETGLISGAEVSAGIFVWIHSYPSMETHYAALAARELKYLSEQAAWANSFEDAIRGVVLVMTDGSFINAPVPISTEFDGGVLKSHGRFKFPIELSALEKISGFE